MLDWLLANKEWVFSGVGVAALSFIGRLVLRRPKRGEEELRHSPERLTSHAGSSVRTPTRDGRTDHPWSQGPDDSVAPICATIMRHFRDADDSMLYLEPLRRHLSAGKLQMEEAVSRLIHLGFVELLGGYPYDVTLHLTRRGRSYLIDSPLDER